MRAHYRSIVAAVLVTLLCGCATRTSAPIDSRNNQQSTSAKTTSRPSSSATSSKRPEYYVVQGGDTLYSIAWHLGVNYRELASLNGIRSPYTIYRGQRLRLKPASGQPAAKPAALRSRPSVTAAPAPAPAAASAVAKPLPKPPPSPLPKSTPGPAGKPVAAAKQPSAAPAYDGKWVWPTRGRVLSGFQSSGTGKKGIDIGGHADQPVKAAANGKVVYAGSGLVGYGRLIIVKHNENLLSAYGHNNKLLVNEGEHVSAGQMIAKMGSSGTNRNELYFEIRKNGKPTDPMRYLPKQ